MQTSKLDSGSVWLSKPRPRFAAVTHPERYDVVVIGAGITGLTAAYLLKKAGKRVGVFEKRRNGDGETGFTTAHLIMMTDLRLRELVKNFGEEAAGLAWRAGRSAIDTIEAIIQQEQIDCHFQRVPGFIHAAIEKETDEAAELQEEAELANRLGFDATYLLSVPLFDRPGVRYPDQALFHPIEYLAGLAKAFSGDGCEIHEHSEVEEVSTEPLAVKVKGQSIACDRVVIATHVPLMGSKNLASATLFQTKLYGYSTYAIGAKVQRDSIPHVSLNDTDDPYYYLRVDRLGQEDFVIFGGKDHKTGQHADPAKNYAALESLLKTFVKDANVTHRWSGQVIETNDGLPFIGPDSETQFIATGYAGNGMTFGTLAGMMATDWVLARENPWTDLFSVTRKKIRGGLWDYIKENVDFPFHLVSGYLKPTEGDTVATVRKGQGKILKINGQRCAVSRDAEGAVTACSAVCTHMGCIVRWNRTESTWDCPCHGSRFSTDGKVIAGPAESPLSPVDLAGKP